MHSIVYAQPVAFFAAVAMVRVLVFAGVFVVLAVVMLVVCFANAAVVMEMRVVVVRSAANFTEQDALATRFEQRTQTNQIIDRRRPTH